MQQLFKTIVKYFCSVFLIVLLFSTECLAANPISSYDVYGYRCTNSGPCNGARLNYAGPSGTYCSSCKEPTAGYDCPICHKQYNICLQGHYNT